MIDRERLAHEVRRDETDEADDAHLPTAAAVASETIPSSVRRSAGSERPRDCAVSSPNVSASSPRERSEAGTMQRQKTMPSKPAEDQLMKPVLPNKNVCMLRQMSGLVSSRSCVIAPSKKATTTPESRRLRVCSTPRERLTVRSVAAPAPKTGGAR